MTARSNKRARVDDAAEPAEPPKRPSRRTAATPKAAQSKSKPKGKAGTADKTSGKTQKPPPRQKAPKKRPEEPRKQRNGFLETPYTQHVRQAQRQLTTIAYVWVIVCATCGSIMNDAPGDGSIITHVP